jgi:hypothetical protein
VPAVPSTFIIFRDGVPVRTLSGNRQRGDHEEVLTLAHGAAARS